MRSPMPCRFLAPCLILFLGSAMLAADPAKPAERESSLAKLKANKVSLLSLTIESKDGGPAINLGTVYKADHLRGLGASGRIGQDGRPLPVRDEFRR